MKRSLDRVLRCDDKERVGYRVRDSADRDLLFGHHFEQSGLHLCRCPIDLVCEQEVDKYGAELDVECFTACSVDACSDDV